MEASQSGSNTYGYSCLSCGMWVSNGCLHQCPSYPYRWLPTSPTWTITTTTNGWKCPGCGACFAPSVSVCINCKPTPTESDSWPSSLEFADDEKATDADELDPEHDKYPESESFDGTAQSRYPGQRSIDVPVRWRERLESD